MAPWKSKGGWMFALLVVVCSAWALAPRAPESPSRRHNAARDENANAGPMAAVWGAKIVHSGYPALPEGTSCEITADVGARDVPFMQRVRLSCMGTPFYASTPNPAVRASLTQRFGKEPGTIVFEGSYDDNTLVPPHFRFGRAASARPRADADDVTGHLQMGVGPDDGIDLRVDRTSAPRMSKPLGTLASVAFDRGAHVTHASGKRTSALGTACRVQLMPASADECDVSIDCRLADQSGYSERFPHMACNAGAAATDTPLSLGDVNAKPGTTLHFASVDQPFTLTARIPDPWLLELTLDAKKD